MNQELNDFAKANPIAVGKRAWTQDSGSTLHTQWIPPAGFAEPTENTRDPILVSKILVPDTQSAAELPTNMSVVQIIVTQAYQAQIQIYDYQGLLIRVFDQNFGYAGELENANRKVQGGYSSFLVWDTLDEQGKTADVGVYTWKINLQMDGREEKVVSAKTGLLGKDCVDSFN